MHTWLKSITKFVKKQQLTENCNRNIALNVFFKESCATRPSGATLFEELHIERKQIIHST